MTNGRWDGAEERTGGHDCAIKRQAEQIRELRSQVNIASGIAFVLLCLLLGVLGWR